jgi:hypothetical protein
LGLSGIRSLLIKTRAFNTLGEALGSNMLRFAASAPVRENAAMVLRPQAFLDICGSAEIALERRNQRPVRPPNEAAICTQMSRKYPLVEWI